MESIPAPTSSLRHEPEAYVCQMSKAKNGIWKGSRLPEVSYIGGIIILMI